MNATTLKKDSRVVASRPQEDLVILHCFFKKKSHYL